MMEKGVRFYDLTGGKYPQLFNSSNTYKEQLSYMEELKHRRFQILFNTHTNLKSALSNIPVFLVETSMANKYVEVPGGLILQDISLSCAICVPEDRFIEEKVDFDIDEWVKQKECCPQEENTAKRTSKDFSVYDLLGVYISDKQSFAPRRIFVWMDKIAAYGSNACALFSLTVTHELGHALMDVGLYGLCPSPYFSYSQDYVYRFIEEAYANAIALGATDKYLQPAEQQFVETFVKNQGNGYSHGWKMMRDFITKVQVSSSTHNTARFIHFDHIDQWMSAKVLFNYEVALLLKEIWKYRDIEGLDFVKTVGHDGWIAVKDHHGKWGIVEIQSQQMVNGFNKYDSFWTFDENGLCMVRNGKLYGYVNLQGVEQIPVEYDNLYSFKNGTCIVKTKGEYGDEYGAIDLNNRIVIPINKFSREVVEKELNNFIDKH